MVYYCFINRQIMAILDRVGYTNPEENDHDKAGSCQLCSSFDLPNLAHTYVGSWEQHGANLIFGAKKGEISERV